MHGSGWRGRWTGLGRRAVATVTSLVAVFTGSAIQAQPAEPLLELPTANTPQSLSDTGEELVQADQPLAEEPSGAAVPASGPADSNGASPPAASAVTIGSRTDVVLRMNQAIAVFNRSQNPGNYEGRAEAAAIFGALLQRDPDNRTCLYHLGLIEIRNGIDYSTDSSGAVDLAREAADPNERNNQLARAVDLDRKAKSAFDAARDYFKKLVEQDAALRATEGGLYLGIAQLALDEGVSVDESTERDRVKRQINSEAFLENSRTAETILMPYVDSEAGRNDPYGRFFLGIARFRLGLRDDMQNSGYHEKAMKDFEDCKSIAVAATNQASEYEVTLTDFNSTVDYYEGLIYAIRDDRPEAIRIFESLSADPKLPPRVQKNAQSILTALQDDSGSTVGPTMSTKTPLGWLSLEGNVGVGNFYDTNVILLGKHQPLPFGITRKDDYRFGLDAGLDATLYADEATLKKNNWFGKSLLLGVGGQTTNLWQLSINEYQINTYNGRAYINYEPVDNLYFGLRYDYTWAMLGSDPFFGSHRILPSISYSWRKDFDRRKDEITRTDVYYINDYRTYHDEIPDYRFDRTGEYQAFGFTQTLNVAKAEEIWQDYYNGLNSGSREQFDRDRLAHVWVGYNYRDEQTRGTEFDLVGDTLLFGFDIPLPKRLTFDFRAAWTWDDYDNSSALDYRGDARHDMIQDYQFGLTYTIIAKGEYRPWESLEMKLRGSIQAIMEDSNIWNRQYEEPYTYNRNIYGLQLFINF